MDSRSSESVATPAYEMSDPLAAVISLLRPRTVLSKVITGAGRWSVRYEAHEDPGFCLMLEGSCFLDIDRVASLDLEAGDFVLLPAIPGFTMSSDRRMKPKAMHGDASERRHGTSSGPPTMRQLGGYFRVDRANAQLVARFLPSVIHIRRTDAGADRVRRLVELIADETGSKRPGRDLVLERLVELLLVEALRFRTAAATEREKGLLAGLADPALSRALRRMHDDVAHRWTVADLARTARMSRAAFADRFARRVGMPPMEYLLEWRLAIAKDVLRRERVPLAQLAERVGYQSASAFSTAFSRAEGRSPRAFARSP